MSDGHLEGVGHRQCVRRVRDRVDVSLDPTALRADPYECRMDCGGAAGRRVVSRPPRLHHLDRSRGRAVVAHDARALRRVVRRHGYGAGHRGILYARATSGHVRQHAVRRVHRQHVGVRDASRDVSMAAVASGCRSE